jgi:hypothetical protein
MSTILSAKKQGTNKQLLINDDIFFIMSDVFVVKYNFSINHTIEGAWWIKKEKTTL